MICDTMVGSLFQHHKIDAVREHLFHKILRIHTHSRYISTLVVGADRIAKNGDTANKIGTYNAAVLAARHNVPFVVVAPITTVDLDVASGSGCASPLPYRPTAPNPDTRSIPIEHRPPLEACMARGALHPPVLDAAGERAQATVLITPVLSAIAPFVRPAPRAASSSSFFPAGVGAREGAGAEAALPPSTPSQGAEAGGPVGGEGESEEELQQVYNPSFDVTPAELIGAIVTEKGVAVREEGEVEFDLVKSGVA